MRSICGLIVTLALIGAAEARGSHYGTRTSYHEPATRFRTSECKSSSCFAKHPDGAWVHPITPRRSRYR